MIHGGKRAGALLFLGDFIAFVLALWLTLLVRYQSWPTEAVFMAHLGPFSVLFALWLLVFYVSGLYGKRIILFKSSLPNALLKTQFFNIVFAALFFFFLPGIGIAPKTNLLIYLVVSLALIFVWRLGIYPKISMRRSRYAAALIGSGEEVSELAHEVNGNPRYRLVFPVVESGSLLAAGGLEAFVARLREEDIHTVVLAHREESATSLVPLLSELSTDFEPFQIVEFADVYESVFDRIPLSLLTEEWFLANVSGDASLLPTIIKREIDLLGALLMGLVTLIAVPFIWVFNRMEGPGPLFIVQERMGRNGTRIRTLKFRSMRFADRSAWAGEDENAITKVGAFLRKTSLDEFPQFVNVLWGELSLIGPRNDLVVLGTRLAEALPYYLMRYRVTPGITGWAQINQQYEQGHISPQSIEETKMRLAYDFYYLKNRSLGLDIVIALKTIKRMFFRVSSW